ncbi:MAG: ArnT family glycosyltransferase [Thermomicrobiales bacterium]
MFFTGFYLLTASGHLYAVDEETLYRMTESLVEQGTLALPADAWGLVTSEQPANGALYSQYEPGQAIAAIPFYLLGRAVVPLFPPSAHAYIVRFFVSLLGSFVTAATVALLYQLARALDYRAAVALTLAVAYGVATFAWPFARTFFAEPLTAYLLLLEFYGLRRGTEPACPRGWLFVSGVAAGAALLTKPHAVLALPCLALYLLGRTVPPRRAWRTVLRAWLSTVPPWLAGLLVFGVPLLVLNAVLYGGPLTTGYSTGRLQGLSYPWLKGLYGMTISSGKGIVWYAPPLFLALLGARQFYHQHRAEALTCLGIVLAHLAFYCRLSLWNGDWAWGPRYLLIMLPFAMLPAAALLERAGQRRVLAGLAAGIIVAGVVVQLLGVLVNPFWDRSRIYDRPATDAERDALIEARYFSPPASPLAVHARLLVARVREWRDRVIVPPNTAVLTGGFTAPETDPARALFPRWTTGAGEVTLHSPAGQAALVKFTFFDLRPATQRHGEAVVLVNGTPLPTEAVVRDNFSGDGQGWTYQFTVPPTALQSGQAIVTLQSQTWNPHAAGRGELDERVGVYVNNVEVWTAGRPWRVRDRPDLLISRAIGALPAEPAPLYSWFNDEYAFSEPSYADPLHHLVDHWLWYAAVGGLGRTRTLVWSALYGGGAILWLIAGAVLLWRAFGPALVVARRDQRKQSHHRRMSPR